MRRGPRNESVTSTARAAHFLAGRIQQVTRNLPSAQVRALVRAVTNRYRRRQYLGGQVPLILRLLDRRSQLFLAPNLRLSILLAPRPQRGFQTLVYRSGLQLEKQVLIHLNPQSASNLNTCHRSLVWLERQMARVDRFEVIHHPVNLMKPSRRTFITPVGQTSASPVPVSPVPRVFRRATGATVGEAGQSRKPASAGTGQTQFDLSGKSNTPEARSANLGIDLNRLTDHVVQSINRRISSHRERLGKI